MDTSNNNELSSDMIFEVLSRACLQTLDSSRMVCKEWNNLTYEPSFMNLHARNTNTVSGYLVQSMISGQYKSKFVFINGNNNMSFEFLHSKKMTIEASSDHGLFVCVSRENHRLDRFYICKPSTQQLAALPNPKTQYLTEKIALMVLTSKPLHYKIVRLSWPSRGLIGQVMYKCEIYDSVTRAWKEIREVLLPSEEFLMHWYTPICARGSVYFLTNKDRVLAFEVKSESYDLFPLPRPAYENSKYERKRIVKYKDMLGFTCKAPNGYLELWIEEEESMEEENGFD